jgi:hypothetical protein
MEIQNPAPPPKNSQISKQQIIEDMMPRIQEAQKLGVQPEMFVKMGNFAQQVGKDKTLYPIFTKALVDQKLAEPNEIPNTFNPQVLGMFVILGKVAEQMIGGTV